MVRCTIDGWAIAFIEGRMTDVDDVEVCRIEPNSLNDRCGENVVVIVRMDVSRLLPPLNGRL